MTDKYGYDGPEQFRPLSPWAYFGYTLLYCIPIRLLPVRWSDLLFYGEQIRAFRERPRSVPTIRDVLLGRDAAQTCLWCALSLITLRFERKVRSCAKS